MKNTILLFAVCCFSLTQLIGQTATISGEIRTEVGDEVWGAKVTLFDNQGNAIDSLDLPSSNDFSFSDLPTGNTYKIKVSKRINPLNGHSTFDLVLSAKHILGIELVDSPYKLLAADVNFTDSFTTLDMLLMRRLILQIDTEFPVEPSWRFVPENLVFQDPQNPYAEANQDSSVTVQLQGDLTVNIIGIKLGDLNSSVMPEN